MSVHIVYLDLCTVLTYKFLCIRFLPEFFSLLFSCRLVLVRSDKISNRRIIIMKEIRILSAQ